MTYFTSNEYANICKFSCICQEIAPDLDNFLFPFLMGLPFPLPPHPPFSRFKMSQPFVSSLIYHIFLILDLNMCPSQCQLPPPFFMKDYFPLFTFLYISTHLNLSMKLLHLKVPVVNITIFFLTLFLFVIFFFLHLFLMPFFLHFLLE